jgi:nicotinate-nucleotide pyrophosphorylase (carboxylating)
MLHRWHGTIELIQRALAEDEAMADVTTALLPPGLDGRSVMLAKEPGVLAGVEVALEVFRQVDPSVRCQPLTSDGDHVEPGQQVALIQGSLDGILRAERTALNFVQRMSGVATATNAFVQAVAGTRAIVIDTRKTVPGWRLLDKYAVRMGGGRNHRMSLADGVLIKDNHIAAATAAGMSLAELVRKAMAEAPHMVRVEVEVETVEQAQEALAAGVDILLLDNMDLDTMRRVVEMCHGSAITEASGGITLNTVRGVAETGVGLISTGAITHSVRALDISLETNPSASAS